jgi:hypothetical protein
MMAGDCVHASAHAEAACQDQHHLPLPSVLGRGEEHLKLKLCQHLKFHS